MVASEYISKIQDRRVDCWSYLIEMTVGQYLNLANEAYTNRGGIKHQRDALKTTSARRIRLRLVDDLTRGAVIPPLVIGIVVKEDKWQGLNDIARPQEVNDLLRTYIHDLSIIDGMQRTTALKEACMADLSVEEHIIRVEAWVARTTDSLIYRMLVLNTGQVPWNLKQQLEVIYAPLVNAISNKVKFSRLLIGGERRWKGGELRSDSLIESYIAFGLRRAEVDTQESLADEFSRLDIAEALTAKKYNKYFYRIMQMLVDFDVAISRYNEVTSPEVSDSTDGDDGSEKIKKGKLLVRGRNVFDTQAARVGFVVACAVSVLGRVGMDKEEAASEERCKTLEGGCHTLIEKLSRMGSEELCEFISLDVLTEKLSRRPSSAVGRWERAFFENSFKVLIEENFSVPNLETCWRA